MNRVFSHPSGNLCSVAVDHLIAYGQALPIGLRRIKSTLAAIADARPDAVTMHKGIAASAWAPYAGRMPLILQSSLIRPDDTACEQIATPEDAVRLGADAFAVAAFIRGDTEAAHLRTVSRMRAAGRGVRHAGHLPHLSASFDERWKFPLSRTTLPGPCDAPSKMGVDVVKSPFCGDVEAYAQIVADSSAAGGRCRRAKSEYPFKRRWR